MAAPFTPDLVKRQHSTSCYRFHVPTEVAVQSLSLDEGVHIISAQYTTTQTHVLLQSQEKAQAMQMEQVEYRAARG